MTPTVTIGPAKLYLGNSYEIRGSIGWHDCDCEDPPYDFDNEGGGKWRKDRPAGRQMIDEGLTDGFEHTIINPLLCGSVVVFCHVDQIGPLKTYLDGTFHRVAMLNWLKPNPSPHRNKHYLADTETYFHCWNRGYHPIGDHHDMHRWISSPSMPSKTYGHSTVKPDAVMEKIMRNINAQSVCDPFMGTGSTGVAAILSGKTFSGIEHNEKHFETAVKRITEAVRIMEEA